MGQECELYLNDERCASRELNVNSDCFVLGNLIEDGCWWLR